MTSELLIIVETGYCVRLGQVLSYCFAGYKLGKCNGVDTVHFEYRFKYSIQSYQKSLFICILSILQIFQKLSFSVFLLFFILLFYREILYFFFVLKAKI